MHRLMQNGQAKDYLLRLNGNMQQEVAKQVTCMRGVISSNLMGSGWRMFMKESFRNLMMHPMALQVLHQLNNFRPKVMDYMILLAMYGNGAVTGTGPIIIKHSIALKLQIIRKDRIFHSTLLSQLLKRKYSEAVLFYALINIAPAIW